MLLAYVARRLALVPLTLLGVAVIVFLLARVIPGDPAQLAAGEQATLEMVETFRKEFKLDTARIILGHHSAAVAEIYAERDEQEAIEAIAKVG